MNRHDLVEAFMQFRRECIWLRRCYNTHSALYAGGEETDELLMSVAGSFFWDISRVLQEYCIQRVCSLTDPAGPPDARNLCVQSINLSLEEQGLLTPRVAALAEQLHAYRRLVVKARNKILSHFDLKTSLSEETLGEHSMEEVQQFYEDLQEYVDEVGVALGVGPLDFRATPADGDAVDLLRYLKSRANKSLQPTRLKPRG